MAVKKQDFIIDANFKRLRNYWLAYALGLVTYLLGLLVNCRLVFGQFVPVWDGVSWYLTFNLVVLFPVVCIVGEKVIVRHYRSRVPQVGDASTALQNQHIYVHMGGPFLIGGSMRVKRTNSHTGDFDYVTRRLIDFLGVVLAPLVLVGVLGILGWQKLTDR